MPQNGPGPIPAISMMRRPDRGVSMVRSSAAAGGDEIIELEIVRNDETARGRKSEPARVDHFEAGVGDQPGKLVGGEEFVPIMRAARDAAGALGEQDQREAGLRGAVGRREDQQAVLGERGGEAMDEGGGIGDMLDHLERGYEI